MKTQKFALVKKLANRKIYKLLGDSKEYVGFGPMPFDYCDAVDVIARDYRNDECSKGLFFNTMDEVRKSFKDFLYSVGEDSFYYVDEEYCKADGGDYSIMTIDFEVEED